MKATAITLKPDKINIRATENGVQTVSAKELYNWLTPKTRFNTWIKRMLEYGFIENLDFYPFLGKSKKGRPTKEYALTLDCAKNIAMIQRTEKGRQIRRYFIEVEKRFRAIATPQQINELYNRVSELESRQIEYANDWTVDRYLNVNGFRNRQVISRQQLGKLCTKQFRLSMGCEPKKVPHPSYPKGQNVYPYELINEVYHNYIRNN